MNEIKKYKGTWFIPELKSKPISGELNLYPNSRIELELLGHFPKDNPNKHLKIKIVNGFSSDGTLLTLVTGLEIVRKTNYPGTPYSKITFSHLFIGHNFKTINEIQFEKVFVQYDNLDNWVNQSGFKITQKVSPNYEINIDYKKPENILYTIDNEMKLGFSFSVKGIKETIYQKSVSMEQDTNLHIEYSKPIEWEKLIQKVYSFQDFLTLAVFYVVYPQKVIFINKNIRHTMGSMSFPKEIEYYYTKAQNLKESKYIDNIQMLFGFQEIKDDFEIIVSKWFLTEEQMKSSINLLMDNIYNSKVFTTNHFLNLAQALETFHRNTNNNYSMPKEIHKKMKDEILKNTPDEYKNWLKEKLAFSNELTLFERISELSENIHSKSLKAFLESYKEFAKDVKDTRNYYTHFNKKLEKKAKKGQELFNLTEIMKFILIEHILFNLGIKSEKINEFVSRNEIYFMNYLK